MKAIRFLLFPFAILYDLITSIRNYCYNSGIFKSTKFDLPVIAVGNLNVGGTGKSPQIEYLIRLLQDHYKVAVLSRGYRRKTKGFIQINENHTAEDVGDEPLQFFKKFSKVTAVVDADRVHGIQQIIQNNNPEVILLDDAFQHRKLHAGFYVMLTKYGDLFCDDYVLPTGYLRENRGGAKRSDAIVVTKCPKNLSEEEKRRISQKIQKYSEQPIFYSTISYNGTTKGHTKVSLDKLQDYEVLLVTGIANPKPLLNYLDELGCNYQHKNYPDHHNFSSSDIMEIRKNYNQLSSDKRILLTTEKDFMRLADKIEELSYIEIQSTFLSDKESFDALILNAIK